MPLYKEDSLLPLDLNIEFALGKFIWKLHNEKLPTTISEIFLKHNVLPNDRDPQKYILPFRRTEIAKQFITCDGIKIWNYKVPASAKRIPTLKNFSRTLKKYLLTTL